jgi:hypothetical protein
MGRLRRGADLDPEEPEGTCETLETSKPEIDPGNSLQIADVVEDDLRNGDPPRFCLAMDA